MAARYKARLGERIREARDAKGLTQADVARLLPGTVDGSQVSRWERGVVQPQPDNLDALAAALDVDVAYFLSPAPAEGTGDLMGSLDRPGSQLDRIEQTVNQLHAAVALLLDQLQVAETQPPAEQPATPLRRTEKRNGGTGTAG